MKVDLGRTYGKNYGKTCVIEPCPFRPELLFYVAVKNGDCRLKILFPTFLGMAESKPVSGVLDVDTFLGTPFFLYYRANLQGPVRYAAEGRFWALVLMVVISGYQLRQWRI